MKAEPGLPVACSISVSSAPEHTGVLLVAVTGGVGVTVALITDVTEQLPTDTTSVYTPEASGVAFSIIGFAAVDVNELGPVQLYNTPAVAENANSIKVSSWHIVAPGGPGLFVLITGVSGVVSTTAVI